MLRLFKHFGYTQMFSPIESPGNVDRTQLICESAITPTNYSSSYDHYHELYFIGAYYRYILRRIPIHLAYCIFPFSNAYTTY